MVSVLVAPDKFKGSLSADEVARALEQGLSEGAPHARVRRLASADGERGVWPPPARAASVPRRSR